MNLHPYMLHGGDSSEGAVLAFDYSAQGAKVLGWRTCPEFQDICGDEYIHARAKRLPSKPHITEQMVDPVKPHVIVSPRSCPNCEKWGGKAGDGGCEFCESEEQ